MPHLTYNSSEHPETTYSDVFLVPNNGTNKRLEGMVQDQIQSAEWASLRESYETARSLFEENHTSEMRQQMRDAYENLRCFEMDAAQNHPASTGLSSRDDFDFTPRDGFGNTPIVIANMNKVTGKRMAEAAAMMGATAAIPQDKSDDELREIAEYLHSRRPPYRTPVYATPDEKIGLLYDAFGKRDSSTAVVTNDKNVLKGVISKSDIPLDKGVDTDRTVEEFIQYDNIVHAKEGISPKEALDLMHKERVDFLPILDRHKRVVGVLTKEHASLNHRYIPHTHPDTGGLAMLATVGALNKNPIDRVKLLIDLQVRGILLDTAHFDQGIQTYRNIEKVRELVEAHDPSITIIAGNIVTREATRNILTAGADIAKVGIGPGAMCTTRTQTGTGRPQFTAVLECAEEADYFGGDVWADGGIKLPRDSDLAFAAGASQVMIGSLFAATYESPPDLQVDERGRKYVFNYGMASRNASMLRNRNGSRESWRDILGHRAEGESKVPVYQRGGEESAARIIHTYMDGLSSAATYAGASNQQEFTDNAVVGIQTNGGYVEGQSVSKL